MLAAKHLKGTTFYLLAFAVLLASALYPISAWGNELVDYVPPSEIAAGEFFYSHSPSSYSIASRPSRIWGYRSLETLHLHTSGPYHWRFTVAGDSVQTHWSFLGKHHKMASFVQEKDPLGQIYDGTTVQILVRRELFD